MSWRWLSFFRPWVLFVALAFGLHSHTHRYQLDVTLELEAPPLAVAQVFYSLDGSTYHPEHAQIMVRRNNASGTSFHARLFTKQAIASLRLDPSNMAGELLWSSLTLSGAGGQQTSRGAELLPLAQKTDQLQLQSATEAGQRLLATGIDPKIWVAVPPAVTRHPSAARWSHVTTVLAWSAFWVLLMEVLLWRPAYRRVVLSHSRALLDRWVVRFSEDATIRFNRSSLLVLFTLLILSVAWVHLKLHQSSLGMWDTMHPPEHVERGISLGSPKAIRTDEWNTFTPWMLSQVQTGMKLDNIGFGAPGSPLLTGAPVMNPLMLAQPKHWGFLILDIERGFAWFWAFKLFGLIAAFFLLLLALTKGDTAVSLAGALGLYGSSYVQWWYSSVPPELVSGFSVAVVGSIYLLQAQKTGGMLLGAVLLSLAVPNLLLNLYPPYLLPLAYLSVFVLLGHLGHRAAIHLFTQRFRTRAVFLALTLLAWVGLISIWYLESRDTIALMLNTAYPGRRFEMGGDLPLDRLFYGFFESLQIHQYGPPFGPSNPVAMSSMWLLFPFLFLLVPPKRWLEPDNRLILGVMVFCLIALSWASIPLPHGIRLALAHAGWHMSQAARSPLGLGVASTIMISVVMSRSARGELTLVKWPTPVLSSMAFVIILVYGLWLQAQDPEFFIWFRLILASMLVAGFVWAIHRGYRYLYLALAVVVAVPALHVNPLQNGLNFYLEKGLFVNAKRASSPTDVWAVYGSLYVAQGFKASGLNVLNGTHYAPRMDMIRVLDPQALYTHEWNRYAHVELLSGLPGEQPVFKLIFDDHYQIKLDVCGEHIRALGVTRLAYSAPPTQAERQCLEPIPTDDHSGVQLFRLRSH